MAAVDKITVAESATGLAADWLTLGAGDHVIQFRWAGSAGAADLVMRSNEAAFADVIGADGSKVAVTTNTAVVVAGGSDYSVEVDTATSALTVTAVRCTP